MNTPASASDMIRPSFTVVSAAGVACGAGVGAATGAPAEEAGGAEGAFALVQAISAASRRIAAPRHIVLLRQASRAWPATGGPARQAPRCRWVMRPDRLVHAA